ncbi:MAG: flippase-like domain-containing protein [Chloroflexi bacterium]|nr:flippase-like domain-containing protein [Chloroflexota bacterium]
MRRLKALAQNRRLVNGVKLVIAGGLLLWLVKSGRLDLALLIRTPITIWYVLGMLLLLGSMVLQAVRWWWLVRSQSIGISLSEAIRLSWMGQFFSVLLPGATGGELVRAYYISQESATITSGVSTVLVDRAIGLYVLILLGAPSVWLLGRAGGEFAAGVRQIGAAIVLILVVLTSGFLLLWWEPTRAFALKLIPVRFRASLEATIESYHARPRVLLAAALLSALSSTLYLITFLMASRSLGLSIGWQVIFLVIPLVTMANSLPLAPGGVGVAETTSFLLFSQFGVIQGAAIMLLVRLWIMLLRLPGAAFYVMRGRDERRAANAVASQR